MDSSSRLDLDARQMLGVRLARNAPIVFVSAEGIEARPGERVIVKIDADERERQATVAIATGYLVSARGVRPSGAAVRLA